MDFFFFSLPEALYGYQGLALDMLLRHSWLVYGVRVECAIFFVVLLMRGAGSLAGMWRLGGWMLTTLIYLILFWPEVLPFGAGSLTETSPAQVASYVASQDPNAEVMTAEDTGEVWPVFQDGALIPPGTRLLLKPITNLSLALAKAINSEAHRTLPSLMPMQWLLGTALTTDVIADVGDWVHNCYLPAKTSTLEGEQEARTVQQLLPWGDTPIARALASMAVTPGSQTGAVFLKGPMSDNKTPCTIYLLAIEQVTQSWLRDSVKTPNGMALSQAVFETIGQDIAWQARFLIYREILRAAGPAVPAPSFVGIYTALRGLGAMGKAAEGGLIGGVSGWFSGAAAWAQVFFGISKGAVAGLQGEFQRVIDGLSWIVGIAVMLTWIGPYVFGVALLMVLGLRPLVLFWALIPSQQFLPMAFYWMFVLFLTMSPLWWALVDLANKLSAVQAPQSDDLLLGLGNGTLQYLWGISVAVCAVPVIVIVSGTIVFVGFRVGTNFWQRMV